MEVEYSGAPGEQQDTSLQKIQLNLIALIRTAQGQNGVKHGDYARYRRHCKNKLQSLYKALKLQHGKTKYIKRKIEPQTVTDVRYLHIPIFSAERAWAFAMIFKKEIEDDMDLKKRRHLIARLRKAALWAKDIARLAAARCDTTGQLEAQAYAAFLAGSELVERGQQWKRALALLTRARHILVSMSALGSSAEQQALYLQQVEDIEPTIRYCAYKLAGPGKEPPYEPELLAMAEQSPLLMVTRNLVLRQDYVIKLQQLFVQEEGAMPTAQISAAISSLAAETGAVQSAASSVTLTWQGRDLVVRPQRLQAAVSQVHTLTSELSSCMDDSSEAAGQGNAKATAYERLIKALHEARASAHQAIKSSTDPEGSESVRELAAVEEALAGLLAVRQAELAQIQVRDVEAKFARGLDRIAAAASGKKGGKDKERRGDIVSRIEEVVRCLDGLLRALAELADVGARGGGRAGEDMYDMATAKTECIRATRIYYTAHYLLAGGQALEAFALFDRAAGRLSDAAVGCPDKEMSTHTNQLAQQANVFKSVAQAEAAAAATSQREGVETGINKLGLADQQAQPTEAATTKWLMDALDSWESFAGTKGTNARIYQLPFRMQPIPCRPIMLDTAASHIQYPSIDHRLKKAEKKSVLSSLGLGWAWGKK